MAAIDQRGSVAATSDVVTCHKRLREMLVNSMGFDDEVHNVLSEDICKIDLHDGACYVPGKGFQGARVSLPLAHAHRVMDIYEHYAQPIVAVASVFNPGENLTNAQYDAICERALQDKSRVMRMTQQTLIEKGSDVAQFFAHYGKMSNTRNMYKRSKDGKHSGAMCIWSSPDVSTDDLSDLHGILAQISDLNGGKAGSSIADGSVDMCDDDDFDNGGEDDDCNEKPNSKHRCSEDESLHKDLVSNFSSKIQNLRVKADDFNRSYAFALCGALEIPNGSIADERWRKLYTTTACTLSNMSIEGDRLVASMNENRCKDGNAVVFHSPESGSTVYKLNADAAASELRVSSSLGRCTPSSPLQQKKYETEADVKNATAALREVMPHGIQIPPAIDGISSNRYATNESVGSYTEDMVHRDAWMNSSEAHHMSSEFYLSGAPHPVHKDGIKDESGLRLFLDNLVLDHHEEDESVYVPDKNQVVCDIVRKAHPNDWLDVITSDSSVKDSSGTIIGWNIPLNKLRGI